MEVGTNVYVSYKGSQLHGEIIGREFPYYIVRLSNGLELSFYEDEIEVE
jgi:hypothetical protein